MGTHEMVQQALNRKFTEFDDSTKAMLSQKVAVALQEKGYFDKLSQAQNKGDSDV